MKSKFANKLKGIDKCIKSLEKKLFLSNIVLRFTARNFLNILKTGYFQ